MNEQQLQKFMTNIALLHKELTNQSREALALQREGITQMELRLQEINRLVAEEVSFEVGKVSDDLRREIAEGGQKGLSDFEKQLADLKAEMQEFAKFAVIAEKRLNSASRSVLMKIGYLSVFALACVIGVALWLGAYYGKIINDNRVSAENLQMYQQTDIVKCGERLCAKIGKNTPAEFRKQGYVLLEMK